MATGIRNNITHWWIFLLRGLLFILLGVYMFSAPFRSYVALSLLFGVIVLLAGVAELIHGFASRNTRGWIWHILLGIIDLILGIVLISNVGISMTILPMILGIWFLFRAISLFSFASRVRRSFWLILGGILTLLFALLIIFNPAFGAMTIVFWTALAFLVAGIFNALLAFRLKEDNDLLNHQSA